MRVSLWRYIWSSKAEHGYAVSEDVTTLDSAIDSRRLQSWEILKVEVVEISLVSTSWHILAMLHEQRALHLVRRSNR
jgi:hypothetical protein